MANELLEGKIGAPGGRPPFGAPEVETMSRHVSPSTNRSYGVLRVTRLWGTSRATVYRHRVVRRAAPKAAARPGRAHVGRGAGRGDPRTSKRLDPLGSDGAVVGFRAVRSPDPAGCEQVMLSLSRRTRDRSDRNPDRRGCAFRRNVIIESGGT
jgi:hypothetical protein